MFAMLGWGAGGVMFGKVADDLGARKVILGGILLMAAGFFGMSLRKIYGNYLSPTGSWWGWRMEPAAWLLFRSW